MSATKPKFNRNLEVQINIRLDAREKRQLERLATREARSMSSLCRAFVRRGLAQAQEQRQ